MTGVSISGSGYKGADFRDAIVNGACVPLSEEQLKTTHSYKTKNLSECAISACRGYPLESDKPLVKYDFRKANLRKAGLRNGDFSNCDFTDANINGIGIVSAKITAKQFASTYNYQKRNLRCMQLGSFQGHADSPSVISGKVDFSEADLTRGSFRSRPLDADFSDATITRCFFDFALTKEQLCSTKNYKEGNLSGIRFCHINLSGCDLSNQNLTGCLFYYCDFSDANIENSVITNIEFGTARRDNECTGLTLAQIKSTWNYKHDRMGRRKKGRPWPEKGMVLPERIAEELAAEKSAKESASKTTP